MSSAFMSTAPILSVENNSDFENLLMISIAQRMNDIKSAMPMPPMLSFKEKSINPRCISVHLQGVPIAGFELGGERRVCVPQMVASLLSSINLDKINGALTKLRIHTQMCDQGQLNALKTSGILQMGADSCPLMTLSDAERLYAYCIKNYTQPHHANLDQDHMRDTVPVYHQCFGGADGELLPELYVNVESPCIKCKRCKLLFSTADFVLHTHVDELESSLCHWGFDSHNWRSYLHLCANVKEQEKLKILLKYVKDKFDDATTSKTHKRLIELDQEKPAKKKRIELPVEPISNDTHEAIIKTLIAIASNKAQADVEGNRQEADAAQALVTMSRKASFPNDAERVDKEAVNYKKDIIHKFREEKRREILELEKAEVKCALMTSKEYKCNADGGDELDALLSLHCPTLEGKLAIRAYFDKQKNAHDAQYAELSLTSKAVQQDLAKNRLLLLAAQSQIGLSVATSLCSDAGFFSHR